jgi:hypothetical protein
MPEVEWPGAIGACLRRQLYNRATAIWSKRSLKERGAVIAAQPLFQRVIPAKGHASPVFPQMSHKAIPRLNFTLLWREGLSIVSMLRKKSHVKVTRITATN